ncbi:MAG: tyrosine-protein phosphatase [Stomatobaculum sp.]|nr:tyrosine-protein phosphatase [Stomatobaculum sp.]
MKTERRIVFEGVTNSRDLGGLPAADGRLIRRGMLLRTANLSAATEGDKSELSGRWRLSLIVDLRTSFGQRRRPDAEVPGAKHLSIPVFEEEMLGISHGGEQHIMFNGQPLPDMERLYRNITVDPGCMAQLGKAIRTIMNHDFSRGSVLWHCSEGKDRCGMTAALLLTALGADRETILEDYLISNETAEAKAQKYYDLFLSAGKGKAAAELVRDAFIVKESYLKGSFEAAEGRYGSLEGYLEEGLKVPAGLIAEFREKMLEN